MDLKNIMGVQEAAERWNVSVDTVNSRIRNLVKNTQKYSGMVDAGLIKQSHKTWILTAELMKIWFGEEKKD
ncbi:MAG: hypothetical protein KBT36_08845 [Kurthia sp.]|nr:hypothetical protein [Candidatus Kurthia equi]